MMSEEEGEFEQKLEEVRLLRRAGFLTEAEKQAEELRENLYRLSPVLRKRRVLGRLITERGRILQERNELPEARECFSRALNIHEAVFLSAVDKNDKEIAMLDAAYAGFDLFYIEHLLKSPKERILSLAAAADSAICQAIEVIEKAEDEARKFVLGNLCYKIGFIRQTQENYKEAFRFYNQSLDFQEETGDEGGIALTCIRLCECHLGLAKIAFVQSLQTFRDIGEEPKITDLSRIYKGFSSEIERHLRECQENSRWALEAKAKTQEFAKYMERVLEKQGRAKGPRLGPVARAKSILASVNDKIEKAHERLLYGDTSFFLSLFPESFLEGAESFLGDLGEEIAAYLGAQRAEIPQRQHKLLEEMLRDFEELMWPIRPEEMSEEEKNEVSDDLKGILYNTNKIFLSASGLLSAARDVDLRGVCEIWRRYLTDSFFLDELKEIVLDVSLFLDPTRDAAEVLEEVEKLSLFILI